MEKKYRALRLVAVIWKILAWIVLVAGILSAIGVVIGSAIGMPLLRNLMDTGMGMVRGASALGFVGGVIAAVGILIATLIQFVLFFAASEIIDVFLAIEQNTREAAYYMRGEGGSAYLQR